MIEYWLPGQSRPQPSSRAALFERSSRKASATLRYVQKHHFNERVIIGNDLITGKKNLTVVLEGASLCNRNNQSLTRRYIPACF
jgi:hypothetical protein